MAEQNKKSLVNTFGDVKIGKKKIPVFLLLVVGVGGFALLLSLVRGKDSLAKDDSEDSFDNPSNNQTSVVNKPDEVTTPTVNEPNPVSVNPIGLDFLNQLKAETFTPYERDAGDETDILDYRLALQRDVSHALLTSKVSNLVPASETKTLNPTLYNSQARKYIEDGTYKYYDTVRKVLVDEPTKNAFWS